MTIIFNLLVLQLDDGAPSALCKWKWPVSMGRGVSLVIMGCRVVVAVVVWVCLLGLLLM